MLETIKQDASHNLYEQFLKRASDVRRLASVMNIKVVPVHDIDSPYFTRLNSAQQKIVVDRLQIYRDSFEMAVKKGAPSEKMILWQALGRLGLVPPSETMGIIAEGDFFEIFVNNIQAYRSFNYHDIVSYSLDELESVPWERLFTRDESIKDFLISEAIKASTTKSIVKSESPSHIVSETDSPFLNQIEYSLKYVVPLRDKEFNQTGCFMTVVDARLVNEASDEKKDQMLEEYLKRKRNLI